jgi:sirohydrochlorin cobaltochelatase
MEKKAILVVSFGTAYPETRARTIDAIEADLASAFPDRRLSRAWTSGFIRRKLKAAGTAIDSVAEAMERMANDGIEDVLIQPTHMLAGEEFDKLCSELAEWKASFASVSVGAPLLAEKSDVETLARLLPAVGPVLAENEMMIWMGHGSPHMELPVYSILNELAPPGHCVGAMEGVPDFDSVLSHVRACRPAKVYLAPLMVVAGSHAVHDMAGASPDSWESRLQREGLAVECIFKGMGEYEAVRAIYTAHARCAKPI